jgi:monoamine oxidase
VRRNGSRDSFELNFLHVPDARVPTWWTPRPAQIPAITGWAGGPRAEELLNEDESTQVGRALDTLSAALGVQRRYLDDQFEGYSFHDWRSDPWSQSAYTYVGVGGTTAQKALARPVKGTLFFAGEATDPDQTGTVAGALASGRRAAKQLLRLLQA